MDTIRRIALIYAVVLAAVTSLNYVPGLTDAQGRAFGIFALDLYDDALHLASALWATFAAWRSRESSATFLRAFGSLYLADGLLGLVSGSGFLDLGIFIYGVQSYPPMIRILGNLPHILLGSIAVYCGFVLARRRT